MKNFADKQNYAEVNRESVVTEQQSAAKMSQFGE